MQGSISCTCEGVITKIRLTELRPESFLVNVKLKVGDEYNQYITVKMFDINRETLTDFQGHYKEGDLIRVIGSPVCDSFVNKQGELKKGIAIYPKQIIFIEHCEEEQIQVRFN